MNLYYTTSRGYNTQQPDPGNSLGGYKSSTQVFNNKFANVFDEITIYSYIKGDDNYMAIILKNDSGADVNNALVWMEEPDGSLPISNWEMAFVTTTPDVEGHPMVERIRDITNQPMHGTFAAYNQANKGSLGSLSNGEEIGIWLKRSINRQAFKTDYDTPYQVNALQPDRYIIREKLKEDVFDLKVSWD